MLTERSFNVPTSSHPWVQKVYHCTAAIPSSAFIFAVNIYMLLKCFLGGFKVFSVKVKSQRYGKRHSKILTRLTDYVHVWLSSLLLTTHFHSFLFFFSSHQFISSAALHLSSTAPSLPVCGKSHQWASGADVQVSGGDQHSYPGETGPGGEGGPAGGAQRQPSPGPQPSGRVSRLRPEPVWLWCPKEQWRTDCTRRETWWMNSSSPPSPSFLLLLSPFNKSSHHPVFGHFHRIQLTLSLVVCLCVLQDAELPRCSGSCRYGDFFKYFHTFEGLFRLLKLSQ